MLDRSQAVRKRRGGAGFVDVAYADLLSDPLAQVRRIYAALGTSLKPDAERQMREYLDLNPQFKHGRHRYRLEDFGLDRETTEREFAEYIKRFEVDRE
jgi:hypothetical protein